MKKLVFVLILIFVFLYDIPKEEVIITNNSNDINLADILLEEIKSNNEKTVTTTIYRTRTGKKYHVYGCIYLNFSCIETNMDEVNKKSLTPCKVCKP